MEFFAPAGYVGAIVRPVSIGATDATRSGIEPGTAGVRYAPAYRCETCLGVAPSSIASAAGGEIATALLSGVYDAVSKGDATVTGHLWTRAGKRRVSLTPLGTPHGASATVRQSSFTTWRVPAVAGAGWFEVFVNLGSGDRASARILAFPPPRTSSSGLTPGVTPAAGGAVVWLVGADMRGHAGDDPNGGVDGGGVDGVLAACVVDDGSGNVFVGHLRPVSSAVAACETPALPRPVPAVSIAAGVVAYDDDDDDDGGGDETEGGVSHETVVGRNGGVRRGRVVRGARPRPSPSPSRRSRRRRRRPPRRCEARGGATSSSFPSRGTSTRPHPRPRPRRPSSDAAGGVGWGCRVGTIGPVTGQPASAGDSTGVGRGVRCVATAMRPGTYPVAVAPLPGGFADENAFENAFGNPPTLAYAPAKASASPHRGSLFVQPGVVVASPGGGSSLNSQKVSVVSADASLVPLAFSASEATARGFASGVRCVVGGAVVGGAWDVRDPHRDDDAALDALRDRLAASCGNGFSRLSPGFTVVHVAWVPSGRNGLMSGGSRTRSSSPVASGEVMVTERPEASTARPDAALASGGAVVMVSGANFVNFVDFGGATSGAPGICAFGSGGRVAVDVGDGAWVSSALVRCEAPPTADASAGGSRAELEPVTISTSSKIFARRRRFTSRSTRDARGRHGYPRARRRVFGRVRGRRPVVGVHRPRARGALGPRGETRNGERRRRRRRRVCARRVPPLNLGGRAARRRSRLLVPVWKHRPRRRVVVLGRGGAVRRAGDEARSRRRDEVLLARTRVARVLGKLSDFRRRIAFR